MIRTSVAVLVLSAPAGAGTFQCRDSLIEVVGKDAGTLERVCRVATSSIGRLAQCGVSLDTRIEIEVKDVIEAGSASCLGLYHWGEGKIELLAPEDMSSKRIDSGTFALISDEAYWDSIVFDREPPLWGSPKPAIP